MSSLTLRNLTSLSTTAHVFFRVELKRVVLSSREFYGSIM